MTRPDPLDYQRKPIRVARRLAPVPTASIAAALGAMNGLWACVAAYVTFGPFPDALRGPATWMLLCGLVPSAILGTLIGATATAGPLRVPALLANAASLAVAAGFLVWGR